MSPECESYRAGAGAVVRQRMLTRRQVIQTFQQGHCKIRCICTGRTDCLFEIASQAFHRGQRLQKGTHVAGGDHCRECAVSFNKMPCLAAYGQTCRMQFRKQVLPRLRSPGTVSLSIEDVSPIEF